MTFTVYKQIHGKTFLRVPLHVSGNIYLLPGTTFSQYSKSQGWIYDSHMHNKSFIVSNITQY